MDVRKISAVVLASAIALHPAAARAQLFELFGGGHTDHHHHDAAGHRVDDSGHHIDNHGNHTGAWGVFDGDHSHEPHYSGGRSGGYSSRYYSRPHTTYYSPNPSSYVAPNVLPRPASPQYNGGPIEIRVAGDAQGSVNYALNEFSYQIGAGQSQTIQSDRAWTITFDRGGGFGAAKYSLTPGVYEFSVTERGWELHKQRSAQPQLTTAPSAPPPPGPATTAPASSTTTTFAPNSIN